MLYNGKTSAKGNVQRAAGKQGTHTPGTGRRTADHPPAGNGDITQTLLPLRPAKTGKGSTEAPARAGRQASTPQEGTTPQPHARHNQRANSTQRTQPHAKQLEKGAIQHDYTKRERVHATLGNAPRKT